MDDLISRAAAIARIDKCVALSGIGLEPVMAVRDVKALISVLPAVDAAPVIRCRDCEHFIDMSGTSYPSYCYKHTTFDADGEFENVFSVESDKYCAWGERRDSE